MEYARKHCTLLVPGEWDSTKAEVPCNIVKVSQNLQFAYAGLLRSDCGREQQ
jgi:hypothetical protein